MSLAPRRPQLVKEAEGRPPESRQPGFFGKLPIRGDFVARRIDNQLRATLDQWLSASITASRRALGQGWADAYRHAPIWRFVFTSGVTGPEPVAGILMPSVDNFGRQFPLVIAVEVTGCATPLRLVRSAEAWFSAAERAALSAGDDGVDLESFDGRVVALGQPVFESDRAATALRFAYGDEIEAARGYAGALEATLGARQDGVTVWWTTGGGGVPGSLLHHRGMPAPERFAAFLDGGFEAAGWSEEIAPPPPEKPTPARSHDGPLHSAARTHRGTR
ncbi:MAG: type VI secretion system-associated protein TagF, partial [Caulobacteraceae bacterium]|nr:type VI secretion system-associated protein TagF [Caulobacter sp.]